MRRIGLAVTLAFGVSLAVLSGETQSSKAPRLRGFAVRTVHGHVGGRRKSFEIDQEPDVLRRIRRS
jgi:hypothetical protein